MRHPDPAVEAAVDGEPRTRGDEQPLILGGCGECGGGQPGRQLAPQRQPAAGHGEPHVGQPLAQRAGQGVAGGDEVGPPLGGQPGGALHQLGEDELLNIALGILHLHDRPRIKSFTRKDPFDRFVSVLAYVPRERYAARMRPMRSQPRPCAASM
ncbi:MAG: NAD-glutamate dehydrogenase, partial [Micrococcales bacterium]|nr:NAD-glutamate dehydrogenase [Micrococcales bacterium]